VLRAWLVSLRGLGLWLTGLMGYQKNPQKVFFCAAGYSPYTSYESPRHQRHQPSGISRQTPIDASL